MSKSGAPLLCLALPHGATGLRFSSQSLDLGLAVDASDQLAVRGPLPPAVGLRASLSAARDARMAELALHFPLRLPQLSVFLTDTGVSAQTTRLHRRRPFRSDDRSYMHLEAFELAAGEPVSLSLARLAPALPLPVAARAGFALLLAGAATAFLIAPLRTPRAEPLPVSRRAAHAAAERIGARGAARSRRRFRHGQARRWGSCTDAQRAPRARRRAARRRARRARGSGSGAGSLRHRLSQLRCRDRAGGALLLAVRERARRHCPRSGDPSRVSEPALRAVGLAKRFGRSVALAGVDLELPQAVSLAVLGPNGAGKSTLLRLIAGLARPTSGSLSRRRHAGASPGGARSRGLHRPRVAALPLAHRAQNLLFAARLQQVEAAALRVEQLLESSGLARVADVPIAGFSRGMSQRLSIARGLIHDPPVLLLDEPFSGLDPRGATALAERLAALRAAGRTLVLVTHDPKRAVELADRAIVLAAGRVCFERCSGEGGAEALERAVLAAGDGAA